MNSYPEEKLLFAVWTQALNDINKGFLLKAGVYEFDNQIKEEEIKENSRDAMEWVHTAPYTFQLVADTFDFPVEIFKKKTIEAINKNKNKIFNRSQVTTRFMYATVSRFRNYEQAFQKNRKSGTKITTPLR